MNFKEWLNIQESSLETLHQSAVDAFPTTIKRQYATNTIKIANIGWLPFVGMKTLFVKGLAQNEGKEYNPTIVFKSVDYNGDIELIASDGKPYNLKQLSLENSDVNVRCNCGDFYWRFNHFNYIDKSLQGRHRKKYEARYHPGSANPEEMPGLCKHLMKLVKALKESKIIG